MNTNMNTTMNTTNQTEDDTKETSPEEMMEELNNTILSLDLKIEKYEKNIKTYSALSLEDEPDRDTKIEKIKADLSTANAELFKAKAQQRQLTTAINTAAKNAGKESVKLQLKEALKDYLEKNPSLAHIGDEDVYYYISDRTTTSKKQNVIEVRKTPIQFARWIAGKNKIDTNMCHPNDVYNFMANENRIFERLVYSIDEQIWNSEEDYLPLKHMEPHFISNVKVDRIDPTVIDYFDQLMYSLSGGKKENQDHIEQWVLQKVLNYREVVNTPELIIVGHVGGNGKGIFAKIVSQMFPSSITSKANNKTLLGDFNSILEGKLVVFFDDLGETEKLHDKVKQLSGNEDMIIEGKGVDQKEIEKTFTGAWFANSLPFKLTPGGGSSGVDRRFSVMQTSMTFLESLQKHAKERGHNASNDVLVTEEELEIDSEQPKGSSKAIYKIVRDIFRDRQCVAQWFQHLKLKHPHVYTKVLPNGEEFEFEALHGEDYKYFLKNQLGSFDVVWEKLVIPATAKGQVVPLFIIAEVMRNLEDSKKPALSSKEIKELADKKIQIDGRYEIADRQRVKIFPGTGKARQCVFIKEKNKQLSEFAFDWSQISTAKWVGDDEIDKNDFIFNSAKLASNPTNNTVQDVKPTLEEIIKKQQRRYQPDYDDIDEIDY